ncbi:putative ADP-ribosylation factor [Blattamonas nauphoetae]|uniref:ADP-ribosylation factor n=1 Tax=Blattamonas nauphoetae TaxID=2049346 RepID=A0ABQ9YBZ7_9EUKA|nr:putative ADP-ribosylation factor [Blattamonas nauphoetae]
MVGLDAAGKTTVLNRLKLGETIMSNPTIGFNVEEVQFENLKMTIWDVGGQKRIRQLWSHYYEGAHGVVYVVDCSDTGRLACSNPDGCEECARCELMECLRSEHLTKAPVLILANKQDIPTAVKPDECSRHLGLQDLPPTRKWHIQGCCALTGQGLTEGFRWLGANSHVSHTDHLENNMEIPTSEEIELIQMEEEDGFEFTKANVLQAYRNALADAKQNNEVEKFHLLNSQGVLISKSTWDPQNPPNLPKTFLAKHIQENSSNTLSPTQSNDFIRDDLEYTEIQLSQSSLTRSNDSPSPIRLDEIQSPPITSSDEWNVDCDKPLIDSILQTIDQLKASLKTLQGLPEAQPIAHRIQTIIDKDNIALETIKLNSKMHRFTPSHFEARRIFFPVINRHLAENKFTICVTRAGRSNRNFKAIFSLLPSEEPGESASTVPTISSSLSKSSPVALTRGKKTVVDWSYISDLPPLSIFSSNREISINFAAWEAQLFRQPRYLGRGSLDLRSILKEATSDETVIITDSSGTMVAELDVTVQVRVALQGMQTDSVGQTVAIVDGCNSGTIQIAEETQQMCLEMDVQRDPQARRRRKRVGEKAPLASTNPHPTPTKEAKPAIPPPVVPAFLLADTSGDATPTHPPSTRTDYALLEMSLAQAEKWFPVDMCLSYKWSEYELNQATSIAKKAPPKLRSGWLQRINSIQGLRKGMESNMKSGLLSPHQYSINLTEMIAQSTQLSQALKDSMPNISKRFDIRAAVVQKELDEINDE